MLEMLAFYGNVIATQCRNFIDSVMALWYTNGNLGMSKLKDEPDALCEIDSLENNILNAEMRE